MIAGPMLCPCCGAPHLWRYEFSEPVEALLLSCEACFIEATSEAALLNAAAELDRAAWKSLPAFVHAVQRDEDTARALRRVIRPLLLAGFDAEIALTIAHAANTLRPRPALRPEVDALAMEIALEVADLRRRGLAA